MSKKRKAPERPTFEQFLVVWENGNTLEAVAKELGLTPPTCTNYAKRLRAAGHKLKFFRLGRPRLLSF